MTRIRFSIYSRHTYPLLIHLFLGLLIGILTVIINTSIEIMKYEVMIIWFWNILSYAKINKTFNTPYIYFLCTFFFFITVRIFLDILGFIDFSNTTSFSNFSYSIYTQRKMLVNIIIALWSTHLGVILFDITRRPIKSVEYTYSHLMYSYGIKLFILTLPFIIYDLYNYFTIFIENGYLSFFQDFRVKDSLLVIIGKAINSIGLILVLIGKPEKKTIHYLLTFYVVYLLTRLSLGQRGEVICQLITIFWAYSQIYKLKISNINIAIFSIILLLAAFIVENTRVNETFSLSNETMIKFLEGQGVSIQVLGYSIEYENSLNDYSLINMFAELRSTLESVFNRLIGTDSQITRNAYNAMKEYGHLGLRLSYSVNSDKFFLGHGLGTSYIAEIYLVFKEFGQFFIGILLGIGIEFLTRITRKSKKGMAFFIIFAPSLFFISRDSLLAFLSNNIIVLSFFIIILIINKKISVMLK